MTFAIIFLLCFVALGGFVIYLSRTIDHGEARFDSSGRLIKDEQRHQGPARPAHRIDNADTPKSGDKE